MRFGLFVPQGWRLDLVGIDPDRQWPTMLSVARAAEEGGFDSVWVYDHFHTRPVPLQEATHEAWALMAALAAATGRVRLGQMCTCVAYRNPAQLAKAAATIDVISGGRLQMGIGAGWYEHEWRAYGYGFPSAGTRLGMLEEGVQIMRQMWTEGLATMSGRHFQVDGAIGNPLPLQPGGIPVWIAGGGEQRTLRIAARYADYTNFDATPEVFRRKSEILAEHCRDLGRDFDSIVRSGNYNVVIGATESQVRSKLAWIREHYERLLPPDVLAEYSQLYADGPLVGTPERLVEVLRQAQAMGLDYAICYFVDAAYDPDGIELFAREVIPALSA